MQSPIVTNASGSIALDRIVSIEFGENNQPVRKVVSRSNMKGSGKDPSTKLGRMVQYESPHECNAFKLLDAWPSVRTYIEQPCFICYILDGEQHKHIPDIFVDFGTQRELWEVKTAEQAREPEVARRTALMTRCLPAFGYTYRLVLGEDLGRKPRLDNVKLIRQKGRKLLTMLEREQVRQLFHASPDHSLLWGFFQRGEPGASHLPHVCRLLLEGVLVIDIDQPLQHSTEIRMSQIQGEQS